MIRKVVLSGLMVVAFGMAIGGEARADHFAPRNRGGVTISIGSGRSGFYYSNGPSYRAMPRYGYGYGQPVFAGPLYGPVYGGGWNNGWGGGWNDGWGGGYGGGRGCNGGGHHHHHGGGFGGW